MRPRRGVDQVAVVIDAEAVGMAIPAMLFDPRGEAVGHHGDDEIRFIVLGVFTGLGYRRVCRAPMAQLRSS
jgi:glucokinase